MSKKTKIGILGNCQIASWARVLPYLYPGVEITLCEYVNQELTVDRKMLSTLKDLDFLILIQGKKEVFTTNAELKNLKTSTQIIDVPSIYFRGFHPDCVYIYSEVGPVRTSFGAKGEWVPHIAFEGMQQGLTNDEILELYTTSTFARLGYFDEWGASRKSLENEFKNYGVPFREWFEYAQNSGLFMWGMNHPTLKVVSKLAAIVFEPILGKEHRAVELIESLVEDPLCDVVWSLLPEIAVRLGLPAIPHLRNGEIVENFEAFITSTVDKWRVEKLEEYSYETVPSLPRLNG